MSADIQPGFSNDELLSIGTRKNKLDLNISATDINRTIPFHLSEQVKQRLDGLSDQQLKDIGEHKAVLPTLAPHQINTLPVSRELPEAIQNVLDGLQSFLGIRTK